MRASLKLLDALVEAGLNFIDTADVYSRWVPGHSGGESETIIGNWMKARGNRDQVIIATKVGSEMGSDKKGLSKAYIRSAVDASLRRLRTDPSISINPIGTISTPSQAETLSVYADLINEGKVRAIGASNFTAARLKEALDTSTRMGLPRYESLQPLYNLYDRSEFEGELEQICQENEIGVIPYYGLASSFLTGKYRSKPISERAPAGGTWGNISTSGDRILAALDQVALHHGVTPAQVALAWLMARPSITAPIASATRLDQLGDLVAATRLRLAPADIEKLDHAGADV